MSGRDVRLDRSTLADWVGRAAFRLRPVHERILGHLRSSTKLFADETTAPVLDPGRGRTKTGQLWAYARDDRPWGGSDRPAVTYVYAPDRKASQPIAHLAGFKGVLQVDGYAGHRALAEKGEVELAFCWAHVRAAVLRPCRRRRRADRERGAATDRAALCDREGHSRPRSWRTSRSQAGAISPDPGGTRTVAVRKLALISQKSKLAEAIRYALSRWEGLTRFWMTAGSRSIPTP